MEKSDSRLQGSESSRQQDQNPMEGYDRTDRNFERPNSESDSDQQNVSDTSGKIKGNDSSLTDDERRKNSLKKDEDLDLDAE